MAAMAAATELELELDDLDEDVDGAVYGDDEDDEAGYDYEEDGEEEQEDEEEEDVEARGMKGPGKKRPRVDGDGCGAKGIAAGAQKKVKTGVAYLRHIPPALRPNKLRSMLSAHAEIGRIYLAPREKAGGEAGAAGSKTSKKAAAGGTKQMRGRNYHEGWVEFMSKSACKRVCSLLHGTPMHGKRRSKHYYDLWCIQYVSKLKWDMINEERCTQITIAVTNHVAQCCVSEHSHTYVHSPRYSRCHHHHPLVHWFVVAAVLVIYDPCFDVAMQRMQKEHRIREEIANARRDRDFYLSRVDQAKAIEAMESRRAHDEGANGAAEDGDSGTRRKTFKKRVFKQRPASSVGESKRRKPGDTGAGEGLLSALFKKD